MVPYMVGCLRRPDGLLAERDLLSVLIQVAKTRKQIREEEEKARLKKQMEEEAAKVAAQQLQQKSADMSEKQNKALAKVEAQEAEVNMKAVLRAICSGRVPNL